MRTFTERPGDTGIYTVQGDYVGSVGEDELRADAIKGLNQEKFIDDEQQELLTACDDFDLKNEEDFQKLSKYKQDFEELQVENGIMLDNLKLISENDLEELQDLDMKYSGMYDCMPLEFFQKVDKLISRIYNLQQDNFGEPRTRPAITPLAKKKTSKARK